jgi:hypothetical protein
MTISRWFLLTTRNASNKRCRENQNTHFTFSNFFSENHAVYEVMSKIWWSQKPQTIWRLRVAYWISKTRRTETHAHTEICNIHCFSTATMVSRTRLNVTLYVHFLSSLHFTTVLLCPCFFRTYFHLLFLDRLLLLSSFLKYYFLHFLRKQ